MTGKRIGDESLLWFWPSDHWSQMIIDLVRNRVRIPDGLLNKKQSREYI